MNGEQNYKLSRKYDTKPDAMVFGSVPNADWHVISWPCLALPISYLVSDYDSASMTFSWYGEVKTANT